MLEVSQTPTYGLSTTLKVKNFGEFRSWASIKLYPGV